MRAQALTLVAASVLLAGAAYYWFVMRQSEPVQDLGEWPEPEEVPDVEIPWDAPVYSVWDDLMNTVAPVSQDQAARNRAAMLLTIRKAEGTAGPNGYRTLFGGALFDGWADHPRIAKQFKDGAGRVLWTSAAGAYQFMAISPIPTGGTTRVNTWDRIRDKIGLQDFGPESQDAAAIELIREAGALRDVDAGRFESAISRIRGIWASLPGAGYGQPERSMGELKAAYMAAGGVVAA